MTVKNISFAILFLFLFVSCSSLKQEYFRNYEDMEFYNSEIKKVPLNLKVIKDNRFVWITNLENISEEQNSINNALSEIIKQNNDLYIKEFDSKYTRFIVVALEKYEQFKDIQKVIGVEPAGKYGAAIFNEMTIEGKKYLCGYLFVNKEAGFGAALHEAVHILNKLNISGYLPGYFDEILTIAITPTRGIVEINNEKMDYFKYCLREYGKKNPSVNISDLIKDAKSNVPFSQWITALFLRYTKEKGGLIALVNEVQAQKDLNTSVIEKSLEKNIENVNIEFKEWLSICGYY